MTCDHGRRNGDECRACDLLDDPSAPAFWGTCDHGTSLAPWMDCADCETREDDFDA